MSYVVVIEKLKKEPVKKAISLLTVVTVFLNMVFFNGLFFGFPEHAEAAVVPSGVIIAWPSTEGTIPAGWSRVAALDDYYLEGTTSTPSAIAGGTTTHTHTAPAHSHDTAHTHTGATAAAVGAVTDGSGTGAAPSAHTHTITTDANTGNNNATSSNFDTASNHPPYTEVIWIQSNGTTGIPSGAWALYNSDTLPASWTRQSGNRFLKGADTGVGGGATGGSSDNHTHTDLGHTHTENAHTHTGTTDAYTTAEVRAAAGTGASASTHVHTISGGSTTATEQSGTGVIANADAQPPFYKLNIIENGAGAAQVPDGIIAMWSGDIASVPTGWEVCDGAGDCPNLNNYFIKGAAADSEIGTTGGALTHTHAAGTAHTHVIDAHTHNFTVAVDAGTEVGVQGGGSSAATYAHTHTLSINDGAKTTGSATTSADANAENRPPYKEIVYIKYTALSVEQSSFRIYENAVDVQPGAALAAENTAVVDVAQGEVLRMRINLYEGTTTIATSSVQFKLQFADKGVAASCLDVAPGNFQDVGLAASSTIWRGYDNGGVADGASITAGLLASTTILESYEEQNPSVLNPRGGGPDDWAEWDWVVQNNGATSTATYCFRMVFADGSELAKYRTMPEVSVVRALLQVRYRWRNDDGGE